MSHVLVIEAGGGTGEATDAANAAAMAPSPMAAIDSCAATARIPPPWGTDGSRAVVRARQRATICCREAVR